LLGFTYGDPRTAFQRGRLSTPELRWWSVRFQFNGTSPPTWHAPNCTSSRPVLRLAAKQRIPAALVTDGAQCPGASRPAAGQHPCDAGPKSVFVRGGGRPPRAAGCRDGPRHHPGLFRTGHAGCASMPGFLGSLLWAAARLPGCEHFRKERARSAPQFCGPRELFRQLGPALAGGRGRRGR